MSAIWTVPFWGILVSIAFLPMWRPVFWQQHYGKVAMGWLSLTAIAIASRFGVTVLVHELLHMAILDYIPFIILLFSLYTIASGVYIRGQLSGSPIINTLQLVLGTALASWIGTTGAAMILIRPFIRANQWRQHRTHQMVFFIFLVANIGGALTPLGDPPLFLGFLHGVSFFWPTKQLLGPMIGVSAALIGIFFLLDTYHYRQEDPAKKPVESKQIQIEGKFNFLLLALAVMSVFMSGVWKPGIDLTIMGQHWALQHMTRDISLLLLAWISWKTTPSERRIENAFSWHPIQEVAKLFLGIFVTIIPVIAMLKADTQGIVKFLVRILFDDTGEPANAIVFWVTGLHSSILDNAPAYLIFFNALGGNAARLMTEYNQSLVAISLGAVFMGAMTYIGNGPNFMVKVIAEDMHVDMPSFFGYIFKYTLPILVPILWVLTWLLF